MTEQCFVRFEFSKTSVIGLFRALFAETENRSTMRGEIQSLAGGAFRAIEPPNLSTIWEAFDRLLKTRNEARSTQSGMREPTSWGAKTATLSESEIDQIDEQLTELAWQAAATRANDPEEVKIKAKILGEFLEEVDDYVETALARSIVSDLA